jgi:hypothetical protein
MRPYAWIIVLGIGVLGGVALWLSLRDEPTSAPQSVPQSVVPEPGTFWGRIRDFDSLSAGVLKVKVRMMNTGKDPGVGECALIAYDRKGAFFSARVASDKTLVPGYGTTIQKRFRVPHKKAQDIRRMEIDC